MDKELEEIRRRKMEKMLEKISQRPVEIEASDDDFEEKVIEQSKGVPVVVDFWAVWCPPCLILGPILEKLANEYNGKFILAKVNVDKGRQTSQRFGIMSIPSVKLFKDGKIVDEFIGAIPETAVRQWLEKNL